MSSDIHVAVVDMDGEGEVYEATPAEIREIFHLARLMPKSWDGADPAALAEAFLGAINPDIKE